MDPFPRESRRERSKRREKEKARKQIKKFFEYAMWFIFISLLVGSIIGLLSQSDNNKNIPKTTIKK